MSNRHAHPTHSHPPSFLSPLVPSLSCPCCSHALKAAMQWQRPRHAGINALSLKCSSRIESPLVVVNCRCRKNSRPSLDREHTGLKPCKRESRNTAQSPSQPNHVSSLPPLMFKKKVRRKKCPKEKLSAHMMENMEEEGTEKGREGERRRREQAGNAPHKKKSVLGETYACPNPAK